MKNSSFKFFVLLILVLLGVFVFFLVKNLNPKKENTEQSQVNEIRKIKIADKILNVELALTPSVQERGLSGRKELKADEGMLFVFDKPGHYLFWMKEMNFPIDIIWLDNDLRVVYIKKDAKPASYPDTFGGGAEAKYVLEVNSGFSEKNNLDVGNIAEFLP